MVSSTVFAEIQDDSRHYAYYDVNAEQKAELSEGQIAQMLAPIALYPDTLLTHVLIAATNPLELVQAHQYVEQNDHLSVEQLTDYGQEQQWDPSVIALMGFSDLLAQLSEDLNWTIALGEAFAYQEQDVLAGIQTLRHEAKYADTLDNLEKVRVVYENDHIIIEPRINNVVYIPVYDTRVVYGDWRWRSYRPVSWRVPHRAKIGFRSGVYWSPSVNIGFDFFFGGFHWVDRHVVVRPFKGTRHYRKRNAIIHHQYAKPYRNKWHNKKYKNNHKSKRFYNNKIKLNKRDRGLLRSESFKTKKRDKSNFNKGKQHRDVIVKKFNKTKKPKYQRANEREFVGEKRFAKQRLKQKEQRRLEVKQNKQKIKQSKQKVKQQKNKLNKQKVKSNTKQKYKKAKNTQKRKQYKSTKHTQKRKQQQRR